MSVFEFPWWLHKCLLERVSLNRDPNNSHSPHLIDLVLKFHFIYNNPLFTLFLVLPLIFWRNVVIVPEFLTFWSGCSNPSGDFSRVPPSNGPFPVIIRLTAQQPFTLLPAFSSSRHSPLPVWTVPHSPDISAFFRFSGQSSSVSFTVCSSSTQLWNDGGSSGPWLGPRPFSSHTLSLG